MINTWLGTGLEVKDLNVLDMYLARLEDEVESAILRELETNQKATEAVLITSLNPKIIEPAAKFLRDTLQYGIIINQDDLEKNTNDDGAQEEVVIELIIRW